MASPDYDAIIVGAGFAGIYQLYKLRQLGLNVLLIEKAPEVGGTWFWNRYPGASSDVHSFVYRFSFDRDDLESSPWPNWYLTQPEVLSYISNVVNKYDLRKHIQLETEFLGGQYDEGDNVWKVKTSGAKKEFLTTRFLITALGALSKKNVPDIKNFEKFEGKVYHTAAWPKEYDFKNKRIGIVGNGSTGSQILVALAKETTTTITSFQRHAQWSVPNGNKSVSSEERAAINSSWGEIWDDVRESNVAFGFPESTIPTFSVSAEERQRIYQEGWDKGNGFRFMFGVFSDTTSDEEANAAACDFIKSKIEEIVKDPKTRQNLIPSEPYARRPICNNGYYETFNQDNVSLVSLKETPFTGLTATGAVTSDGKEHKLDALVLATGFDAITGAYTNLDLRGVGGETLQSHWVDRPFTYLGFSVAHFPNLFLISGPLHPFTNTPPQLEAQIDYITLLIAKAGKNGRIEVTVEAEQQWTGLSNKIVEGSIFHKTKGWMFGDNIPGKKHSTLYWLGGLKNYRDTQTESVQGGFKEYEIVTAA